MRFQEWQMMSMRKLHNIRICFPKVRKFRWNAEMIEFCIQRNPLKITHPHVDQKGYVYGADALDGVQ